MIDWAEPNVVMRIGPARETPDPVTRAEWRCWFALAALDLAVTCLERAAPLSDRLVALRAQIRAEIRNSYGP